MTGCGRGGDTQPNASITNHVPDGAARSELVLVRSVFPIGVRLDTKPGEGRLEACIKAHVADVSDACKVAMANHAAGED
jgi:hypothetical protein